ncbi:MoaD/ThiS family protein [Parapedobacter sp. ISTM3]|uniref:Molybdopterin synthase sulfur carrier subunit n=1 Tax=Parapedobacter luteus TaxID=623280 RepID=A0A1T5B159_9SPHI|nr:MULTISPECIES: MoaD/ThiS family protein [Parapedobacter]MBK1440429.1 MoaD/ThiS family protein [Parapedobacter sp. ISTM3]SKB40962.1 molybdopterin synthase sulfur carrier subunit [Parapedobacter luteus]
MVSNTLSVQFFGQLIELTGCSNVGAPQVDDTDELLRWLYTRYPALQKATYVIAVDRKIVRQNTRLATHAEIAFLPPFSGG